MKPKPTEISPQRDAFLPELADIINARHELVQLAETIDWYSGPRNQDNGLR